jgi:hypothetical protein
VTDTPAFSPEPADHWMPARHRELLDGLGQYLDPAAGLRDIMRHADHADVIGTLGSHLDTQAGLAAILPPPADASSRSPHQTETAAAIAAVDPTVRMALRRNPVILAAIFSDLIVRALAIVDKVHAACERDLTRARDLALDLDLTPALDLDLALDRPRYLALDRGHARALARARDRDRARALALAPKQDGSDGG